MKRQESDGDTLPLSTWRPWREVLGLNHAERVKGRRD